ncbi:MAG: site-specific DNA-methyltransferase [Candidatus Microgenomates bacterium]
MLLVFKNKMQDAQKQVITPNIKISNKNLEKLKKNFPQCFDKNDNFDIEKFKKELSKSKIDFSKESYGIDWLGKNYARLLATDEATTLLKEDEEWNQKEENKNSQNLLIKGDNLEVLKHLFNAYYEQIKMIYIDPPYNTGSDGFVYQDDRKFTVEELSKLAGIDEEKAKRILEFTQSKSNSHSAWLTFMYPRLYIARQLLRDDGVIFVSIDDNEVAQLKILMDEIFGEENFVDVIVRKTKSYDRDKSSKELQKIYDYLLIYSKNISFLKLKQIIKGVKKFTFSDEIGNYKLNPLQNTGPHGYRDQRPNTYYPIYVSKLGEISLEKNNENDIEILPQKIGNKDGTWSWSKEKLLKEKHRVVIKDNKLFIKIYENKNADNNKYVSEQNLQLDFLNLQGTSRLTYLGLRDLFNNPKPVELIKWIINLSCDRNSLIIDFFAGSGTTGDAVMQLNAEDGGNRKYILVQLPEPIDEKKNKTAYDFVKNDLGVDEPTIFEICKERLVKAAKKIKEETINKKIEEKQKEIKELQNKFDFEENKEKITELEKEIEQLKNQDLGFKIFETISLSEGVWEDYLFRAEEFDPRTKLFDEAKLSNEDIKTLLTTWKTYDGISLTQPLKKINLDGYTGYYSNTKLYLMDKGFETKNLKKLLEEIDANPNFNPATIIVFGYNFESKVLREISENVKNYANKKQVDIDFLIRY